MIVAPWLQNTSPADFLRAAEAGTSAGNEISRINLGRQINDRNVAQQQAEMQQRAREEQARNLLLNRELLQRARQSQAQNAIEQQANQSREMLGLIQQDRINSDAESASQDRQAHLGIERDRLGLEKDRNNRLRYIKSGNGAYSFDPTTRETSQIIQPTVPHPKTDNGASRLKLLTTIYPLVSEGSKPGIQKEMEDIVNKKPVDYDPNWKGVPFRTLNSPMPLQPSLPAPSGPQVGDTVNGGVFAGGGVLPVGAGVPVNQSPAAGTLKPSAKPTPSRDDVSYLAAHPEKKAAFESRFGAGSADQYLP